MNSQEKEASEKVMQLLTATWINQPLYVVTKLGILDILAEEPRTIDYLSEITKSYSPFLYRIMRALASVGFFHEDEYRIFSNTPTGELLQKDKMQPIILMFLSDWHNQAWEKLYYSVQTGKIAFDTAFGKPCFEWFKDNQQEADIFNNANQRKATANYIELAKAYDFAQFNSLVDLGGGYGGFLLHILKANPHINGIIADLPYMKEIIEKQISANSLTGQCTFSQCDFFESISDDADCYILSNILHDWNDSKCERILGNCHEAIQSNQKMLIIESIIPGRNEFSIAKLLDIEVLVMGGGKERTETEYRGLLENSGFMVNKIIDTKESVSIIECIKQ